MNIIKSTKMKPFNKAQHKTILVKILREIYSDPKVRHLLGFKGGTAAYLFYGLPRISIDLDFDLLNSQKKEEVFAWMRKNLAKFGQIKDASLKRYTLFFLLTYEAGQRNIKIEVSHRANSFAENFEVQTYLGLPVLAMKKEVMVGGKLSALLTRKKFAARDLFDLWFFLKNDWAISEAVVRKKIGLELSEALTQAIKRVQAVKKTQLLHGLGELLEEKQKDWVRENLQPELLFFLHLYRENLQSSQN